MKKLLHNIGIILGAVFLIVAVFLLLFGMFDSKQKAAENVKPEAVVETEEIVKTEENITTEDISIDLSKYINELRDIGIYDIIGCGNGTFYIGIMCMNQKEYTYFNYTIPVTERDTPVFFTGLLWSEDFEVTQSDDVIHLSIPMRANEYEDYRFRLEVDIDDNAKDWNLQNRTLVLLNEQDIELNSKIQEDIREAGPHSNGEMAKYHGLYADNTWVPEVRKIKESDLKDIKMGAYGGDANALLQLYVSDAGEHETGVDSTSLQLAAAKLTDNEVVFDKINENPLLYPIIYEKSVKNVFWGGALEEAAEAVRTYQEFDFLDSNCVESNIDKSRLNDIPNYDEFLYDYLSSDWGSWELDFDGDGLDELVFFYSGGTMGNEYFEIIHLDKDGLITSVDGGEAMRSLDMYEFNGQYYLANWSYDYNDKQSLGVNLFTMEKDGQLWVGCVRREGKGMRTVISDLYDESMKPLYDELSGQIYSYHQWYKGYSHSDYANVYAYTPDEQTADLFKRTGGGFSYLLIDVDNDGTKEIVGEQSYYPSSAHQIYSYDLWVLKEKDNFLNNISKLLVGTEDCLLRAYPIVYENKNYLLTLQPFGDSQYIYKLQEIAKDRSYILATWIATLEDQVSVTVERQE